MTHEKTRILCCPGSLTGHRALKEKSNHSDPKFIMKMKTGSLTGHRALKEKSNHSDPKFIMKMKTGSYGVSDETLVLFLLLPAISDRFKNKKTINNMEM